MCLFDVANKKKGLVVVVVLLAGEQKMVGFLKSCFKGKKKHIWWWVFSSEETKNNLCLKKNTSQLFVSNPIDRLPTSYDRIDVDRSDKWSDRCSRLKDWRQENFHLPSTMRSMYFFEDEKMATFSSQSSYSFHGG